MYMDKLWHYIIGADEGSICLLLSGFYRPQPGIFCCFPFDVVQSSELDIMREKGNNYVSIKVGTKSFGHYFELPFLCIQSLFLAYLQLLFAYLRPFLSSSVMHFPLVVLVLYGILLARFVIILWFLSKTLKRAYCTLVCSSLRSWWLLVLAFGLFVFHVLFCILDPDGSIHVNSTLTLTVDFATSPSAGASDQLLWPLLLIVFILWMMMKLLLFQSGISCNFRYKLH